jgi:hypothetical protein
VSGAANEKKKGMAASIFDTSFLFTGDIMKILERTTKGFI